MLLIDLENYRSGGEGAPPDVQLFEDDASVAELGAVTVLEEAGDRRVKGIWQCKYTCIHPGTAQLIGIWMVLYRHATHYARRLINSVSRFYTQLLFKVAAEMNKLNGGSNLYTKEVTTSHIGQRRTRRRVREYSLVVEKNGGKYKKQLAS